MLGKITSKEELIHELADALDSSNAECRPYVDLTDQIVSEHLEPGWEDPECLKQLDGHEMVDIEPLNSHEGYEMMEDFARTRNDRECEKIFRAISGRKPFRAFRICVETLDLLEDWYEFKNAALVKIAEAVLGDYDIDFVDGKIVCANPKNVHVFAFDAEKR